MSVSGIWFSCTISMFPVGLKLFSGQLFHYNIRNYTFGPWMKYVIPVFSYIKTITCSIKRCQSYQQRRASPTLFTGSCRFNGNKQQLSIAHNYLQLWNSVLGKCFPKFLGCVERQRILCLRAEKKECNSYDCHTQDTIGVLVNFSHQQMISPTKCDNS